MATLKRIPPLKQSDPGYEELSDVEHEHIYWREWLLSGRAIPETVTGIEREIAEEEQAKLGDGKRYDPNQPRDPGGEGGGQWIKKGTAAAGAAPTGAETFRPEDVPDSVESFYTALADQDSAWVNWLADTAEQYRQVAEDAEVGKPLGESEYQDAVLAKIRVQNTIAATLEGDEDFRSLLGVLDPNGDWQSEFTSGGEFASADTVEKQVAALAIQSWARSAGDSDPISLQLQIAAEQEFGLEANPFVHKAFDGLMAGAGLEPSNPYDMAQAEGDRALRFSDQQMRGARKFLRAQYDLSQEMFAKEGIKDVVVYRGMAWSPREVPPEIETLRSDRYGPRIIAVHGNPLSSWSSRFTTAEGFTSNYDVRAVAGTKVDVRRVLSTPFTGYGALKEGEFVLLGGKDMDAMTWAWNNQYILDPEGDLAISAVTPQHKLVRGTAGPGSGALGSDQGHAAEVDFIANWVAKLAKARGKP